MLFIFDFFNYNEQTKYNKITRFGELSKVILGIEESLKYGIKIKLNVVAIKDFNEEENQTFAEILKKDYSTYEDIPNEVRVLEDKGKLLERKELNHTFFRLH